MPNSQRQHSVPNSLDVGDSSPPHPPSQGTEKRYWSFDESSSRKEDKESPQSTSKLKVDTLLMMKIILPTCFQMNPPST